MREVSRKRVFDGFLSVDEIELESNGKTVRRQVLERGDAVGVLIFSRAKDAFLLVRQHRIAIARHGDPNLLEIVAGAIDPGETPGQAALREAEEEVGYRLRNLRSLGSMLGSPGTLSERIHLFAAEIDEADRVGEGGGIEDEDVEAVWLAPAEAYAMLEADEILDAKTQLALFKVRGEHA